MRTLSCLFLVTMALLASACATAQARVERREITNRALRISRDGGDAWLDVVVMRVVIPRTNARVDVFIARDPESGATYRTAYTANDSFSSAEQTLAALSKILRLAEHKGRIFVFNVSVDIEVDESVLNYASTAEAEQAAREWATNQPRAWKTPRRPDHEIARPKFPACLDASSDPELIVVHLDDVSFTDGAWHITLRECSQRMLVIASPTYELIEWHVVPAEKKEQ